MQGPSKTGQRLGQRVFARNVMQSYFRIFLFGESENVCECVLTTEADREQRERWKQSENQVSVWEKKKTIRATCKLDRDQ